MEHAWLHIVSVAALPRVWGRSHRARRSSPAVAVFMPHCVAFALYLPRIVRSWRVLAYVLTVLRVHVPLMATG